MKLNYKPLNSLLQNKDIIIQNADKGNTIVAIDKDVYKKKMKDIVSDRSKFKNLDILLLIKKKDLGKSLNPCMKKVVFLKVKFSFSFASEVSKFNSKNLMASLDVERLFIKIPLEETIDNIINHLFLTTDKVHNFERKELKQLLTFEYVNFIFDGKYYTQIDGVTMGSPLSPSLVNAFFFNFEKKWLSECPVKFLPNVYKRYFDDIFVTFNSYSPLLKFVERHNINFTFEVEKTSHF